MKKINFLKMLLVLIGVLITSVTIQVWAWGGMVQGCLQYTTPSGNSTICDDDATAATTELSEVSSLTITGLWITNWSKDENYDGCYIDEAQLVWRLYNVRAEEETSKAFQKATTKGSQTSNNREDSWTGTITPTTHSGEYYFKFYYESWFGGNSHPANQYLPAFERYSQIHYTLLPPDVSSFGVSEANHAHGDGSSENPYIIPYGSDLSLTISGSDERGDDNSDPQYYNTDVANGWSTTNTKTINNITSPTKTSVTVKMRFYNEDDDLVGAESVAEIWYKADANYTVNVVAGANGSVTVPSTGFVQVGNYADATITAVANSHYVFDGWTTDDDIDFNDASSASTTITADEAGTVTANFAPVWAIKGGNSTTAGDGDDKMGDWREYKGLAYNSTEGKYIGKIRLDANTVYYFKVYDRGNSDTEWGYGSTDGWRRSFVGQTSVWSTASGEYPMLLLSAGDGDYTFTWNSSTHELSVAYPDVTHHPTSDYVYFHADLEELGWDYITAHIFNGSGNDVTGWNQLPVLSSCTFDGEKYYYAALGGITNILVSEGTQTDDHKDKKTADLTGNTHKGMYYEVIDKNSQASEVVANWKTFDVTVTLNQQNATTESSPTSYTPTYNSTVLADLTNKPEKTGYEFEGFYTGEGRSGTLIIGTDKAWKTVENYTDASKHWIKTASSTLYAKWTQTIDLDREGATEGSEGISAIYNATLDLSSYTAPTKAGNIFAGYWTDDNGTGSLVINNEGVVQASVTDWTDSEKKWIHEGTSKLYAKWISRDAVSTACWDGDTYKCSDIANFDTPKPTGTTNWSTGTNWGGGSAPTIDKEVVLPRPMVVDVANAKAKNIQLASTATLNINADAGLVVAEGITKNGSATSASDLTLLSSSSGNAALVVGEASATTEAGVQFYSKATYNSAAEVGSRYVNQFIGVPLDGMTAYNGFYGTYLYVYDAENDLWANLGNNAEMHPFTAYNLLRKESSAGTLYMEGILNLPGVGGTEELTLTRREADVIANRKSDYLFANSWTAPIDITAMESDDFDGAEATIYIFTAGTVNDYGTSGTAGDPGQWITLPIADVKSKPEDYVLSVIPSMQAFMVKTPKSSAGTSYVLTLDYNKHVYTPAKTNGATIVPTRAPKREMENNSQRLKIQVKGTSGNGDCLMLHERADFSTGFDNGWDGEKVMGKSFAPQLYALSDEGNMAVAAIPEMEGTILGFQAGSEDTEYTFSFSYNDDEALYLLDTENNTYTQISDEGTYNFTTSDKDAHNRFALTRKAPQVATGVDEVTERATNVTKFIENGHLYILRDGKLYNTEGALVK